LFRVFSCFTVGIVQKDRTETLQVGSPAPEFVLEAANREGIFSLAGQRKNGPVIVEFLRGTW
jgi:peroxiredoxin